jgi:hypothetical protein
MLIKLNPGIEFEKGKRNILFVKGLEQIKCSQL